MAVLLSQRDLLRTDPEVTVGGLDLIQLDPGHEAGVPDHQVEWLAERRRESRERRLDPCVRAEEPRADGLVLTEPLDLAAVVVEDEQVVGRRVTPLRELDEALELGSARDHVDVRRLLVHDGRRAVEVEALPARRGVDDRVRAVGLPDDVDRARGSDGVNLIEEVRNVRGQAVVVGQIEHHGPARAAARTR